MKSSRWLVLLSVTLFLLTAGLYILHFIVFRDVRHIFIYMLGDLAFLPVEVLLVSLIINRLLRSREQRVKLTKLNMVIGTFFSEAGSDLLRLFLHFEKDAAALSAAVLQERDWAKKDFRRRLARLQDYRYAIDFARGDWPELKAFLAARREFLLSLLGNPNLLEHDKFTDLLWAVFHLTDELVHRSDFSSLPDADQKHLAQDLHRAFRLLTLEWLAYMQHLKSAYPYLFSLAIRTNPFDPAASPVIR